MRDALGSWDLYSEIQMIRSAFKGTILVLEGPDDALLYDRFVDEARCKTLPGYGRQSVIAAVETADSQLQPGILGIVDADWWLLTKDAPPSQNIIHGSERDAEMMIVHSRALQCVVDEYASKEKVAKFLEKRQGTSVRDILLQLLLPCGALRWISHRDELNLRFQDLDVQNYFRPTDLRFERRRFVQRVLQNTGDPRLRTDDILDQLEKELREQIDPQLIVRGHDFVGLLGRSFRRVLGSCSAGDVSTDRLERSLRLAFSDADFRKTTLYREIRAWEARDETYVVLRAF